MQTQTQNQPQSPRHLPDALRRFPAAAHIAERVTAARQNVRTEFHDQALRAQARLTDLQGVAVDLYEKAQDKARAEKDDVTHRVESWLAKLPSHPWTAKLAAGRLSPGQIVQERAAASLAAWLKLPADVREDVLTVAGIATARQSAAVLEELAALRAELTSHFLHPETKEAVEIKEAVPSRRRTRKDTSPAEA